MVVPTRRGVVGREAECPVTYKGKTATRKVLLETDEIVARGDPRVVVSRARITKAEAKGDVLTLAWEGGTMRLALGKDAARWANEIANPKTRLDKLGVKPGMKVVLRGVTDAALAEEVNAAGAGIAGVLAKNVDIVFLEINAPSGLASVAKARAQIAPAGAVWVLTPRGVAGLKDTDVMKAGKAAGLVDVKVVRFSETHTASKLVIPVAKRPKP